MYKVYVNERPLIFSDIPLEGMKNLKYEGAFTFRMALDILLNTSTESLNIFYHNLDKLWSHLTNELQYIEAAGGLIINEKKELLVIFRNGKWDLPKGKVEQGESLEESAWREVEEECGLTQHKVEEFLMTTYHIYYEGEYTLKATHWFVMNCPSDVELHGQAEEGITEVLWKNMEDITTDINLYYKNIQDCIQYFEERTAEKKQKF